MFYEKQEICQHLRVRPAGAEVSTGSPVDSRSRMENQMQSNDQLGLGDDRVLSLRDAAKAANISVATLRRIVDLGVGPSITRLSRRCLGIRVKHLRAWLDAASASTTTASTKAEAI
jgi:hypothetical protein